VAGRRRCLLYGRLLEALRRLEAGLAMKLRAIERDPFSPLAPGSPWPAAGSSRPPVDGQPKGVILPLSVL